ncbi:hypothetical protein D9M72_604980 [compost metagenome]
MPILDDFCRGAGNNGVRWHVMGNQGAGCDDSAGANSHAFQDHRAMADPDVMPNRDVRNLRVVNQRGVGILKGM